MKLGFVSAILDWMSFEEVIDTASSLGYECVEVACWPCGKAERRYAGVSHIDVDELDDGKAAHILEYCRSKQVEISSLAFYPNTMDGDLEKRAANIEHLKKVILASEKLGVGMVTTFIGRDQTKTVEANMELFREIWPEMFAAIPSDYFGLNYDPSHFVWQMMDYIKPMYEFRDKIFHVHYKDIKLYRDRLNEVGTMAYPLQYMAPKLPGLGDVKWDEYVSALNDIGYKGYTCIEVEDRSFEGSH